MPNICFKLAVAVVVLTLMCWHVRCSCLSPALICLRNRNANTMPSYPLSDRYRFAEIRYHRPEEMHKGRLVPARVETVVIFLPDVWSCIPSRLEWEALQTAYKKQLQDKIAAELSDDTQASTCFSFLHIYIHVVNVFYIWCMQMSHSWDSAMSPGITADSSTCGLVTVLPNHLCAILTDQRRDDTGGLYFRQKLHKPDLKWPWPVSQPLAGGPCPMALHATNSTISDLL